MTDILAAAFQADLGCPEAVAARLASLARVRVPEITGAMEDDDSDLVMRLREPRIFGQFAEICVSTSILSLETRAAVVEHAFDLMPLPRGEGDVIVVEARAPPRLLALASFLIRQRAFTTLHLMHIVYAVFLDRALVRNVERPLRSDALRRVAANAEFTEALRALYVCLHLSAVPEREAHEELRRLLRSREASRSLKQLLATIAAAEDGGSASLARLAQQEGLLPEDEDPESPTVLANVPRMPERLAATARRWLG